MWVQVCGTEQKRGLRAGGGEERTSPEPSPESEELMETTAMENEADKH